MPLRAVRCGALEASQAIASVLCIEALIGYMVRYRSLVSMMSKTPWCSYSESTVKKALRILLEREIIDKEVFSKKRVFYYYAQPPEDIIVEKASVKLEIVRPRLGVFRHVFSLLLRNDGEYPLVYYPALIMGDTARKLRDMKLSIRQSEGRVDWWVYEDTPHTKHIIIRLEDPVKPGGKGLLQVEYMWEEAGSHIDYASCRPTEELEFQLILPKRLAGEIKVFEHELQEPLDRIDITDKGLLTITKAKRLATVSWRGKGPDAFRPVRIQWGPSSII